MSSTHNDIAGIQIGDTVYSNNTIIPIPGKVKEIWNSTKKPWTFLTVEFENGDVLVEEISNFRKNKHPKGFMSGAEELDGVLKDWENIDGSPMDATITILSSIKNTNEYEEVPITPDTIIHLGKLLLSKYNILDSEAENIIFDSKLYKKDKELVLVSNDQVFTFQ